MALANVLKWAWECHEAKTGEVCTWDLNAFAEGISVRFENNFVVASEWTTHRESCLAEVGSVSKKKKVED